ncbi:MAG: cytochrome c maturation protein CcmE [Pseudomonadota bacterium]
MKPVKRNRRLLYLASGGVAVTGAAALVLQALNANLAYFYSPVQIARGEAPAGARIRLGGLVAAGSVVRGGETAVAFDVTDGAATIRVVYDGILPDLFREGQGVIAQGRFAEDGAFAAETILAKHDENYKPKELAEALEDAKASLAKPN